MLLTENWLRPIENIILAIQANKFKIVGFLSSEKNDSVNELVRLLAIGIKLSKLSPLIVDLTKPVQDQRVEDAWNISKEAISEFVLPDIKFIDRYTAHPWIGSRLMFNNKDYLRNIYCDALNQFDLALVSLPEINTQDKFLINPLAAASSCDAVFVICTRNETKRQQVLEIRQALSSVNANLSGVILND